MPRFMLLLVAVAVVASCSGEPTRENPVPAVAAKPALAAVKVPAAAAAKKPAAVVRVRSTRPSTVCGRYRAQLAAAQAPVTRDPTSALARAKVASLRNLVADACE
jgi:hypothetical protein